MTLKPGDIAPDFQLPDQDGNLHRLSDYRGRTVILFAFPKAGTPGCTAQACGFRDEFGQIEASGAVVFGISADTPAELKPWKKNKNLPYPLLSDTKHTTLEQYGAWGIGVGPIKLPAVNRSVWIIDADGRITDMQIGIPPGQSVSKAVKALQTASA